jgi:CRP/FNR family transcriptional regulator
VNLSVLVPERLARLGYESARRRYAPGQLIAEAGTRLDSLLLVISGRVDLVHTTPGGHSQIVRTALPGMFLAEQSLLNSPLTGDLVASEPTEVWMISSSALRAALDQDALLAARLLTVFARELLAAENRMVDLGLHSVDKRLAALILRLASQGDNLVSTVWLPAPWAQVALYLGTTPETISRQMHALARKGVIRMVGKRGIVILDPDRLGEMAQS